MRIRRTGSSSAGGFPDAPSPFPKEAALASLSLFAGKTPVTPWGSVSLPIRSALHGSLPISVNTWRSLSRQAQFELFEQDLQILFRFGVAG